MLGLTCIAPNRYKLPTVTLGILACKMHIRVIVLSILAIILICVGSGVRGGDFLREFQKPSTITRDDDADEHHPCDCFLG